MATGVAVATGDIITAAKQNLKQEDGTALANLGVLDQSGLGAQDLRIVCSENLSANRNLTITVNDAARTIDLRGNLTLAADFITSGANSLTLTTTGATNVTLPTTGTLATLAGTETLTNKTITAATLSGTFPGTPTLSGATITLTGTALALTGGAAYSLGTTDAFALNLRAGGANRLGISNTIGQLTVYQTTANYTLIFSDPSAARDITFPDPGGADSVVYLAATQTLTNKTFTGTLSGTIAGTPTFSGALTMSSTITIDGNVDTVLRGTTPVLDIGADVLESGTFIDIAYDTAETLTGALIGINIDLSTNLTLSNQNINGIIVTMPGTYGTGAEIGIQVVGDGQTINIGNDADLYISLAHANSVDINFRGITPVVDIGADVFETGTFIDIAYDTAETLTGALIGINVDLSTNVTISNQSVTGVDITLPATYGTGTEYGIRVRGDGQTILIGNDADLYLSLTKASSVDILLQGVSPVVDIGADVLASGTFIDLAYDTAETLTGATIGINIDLGTNVTSMGAGEGNLTAIHIDLGPLTLAAAFNGTVYGVHLEADPTLTDENITGILVTMSGTYGTGTEVGIQVTGDGQIINISNDADLYISLAKASSVDINLRGISPVIDIGPDVLENGIIIDIDYDTAETLSGTSLIGLDINFNTNLTYNTDTDVIGATFQTAAFTQSAANTTLIAGYRVPTAGALVQDTAAGTINWRGVDIQLPNTTQTTGTVAAYGIYLVEGTTTSGSVAGLYIDVDIAIDLVTLGNRIDLDADNDTSLRASADDVVLLEINGVDAISFNVQGSTARIQAGTAAEIGIAVTNGALTVGTEGSLQIPRKAGVVADADMGDLDGCFGVDTTGNTLEVRDTAWLSVAVAGYVIQSRVPAVNHGGWYRWNMLWGLQDDKGRELVDETICPICGEHIEPGNDLTSRAITMYPNAYLEKGFQDRHNVHAIFGHAHPEREPYIVSLDERLKAVEEAERILREQIAELKQQRELALLRA